MPTARVARMSSGGVTPSLTRFWAAALSGIRLEASVGDATAVGTGLILATTAVTFRGLTPLALVLFIIWMAVSGQTAWIQLILGAVLAYFIAGLSHYLVRERFHQLLKAAMILRLPLFCILLFREIILANWDVLRRTFSPRLPISPRIASFESFLSSDLARTTLANCITLTPGTVTLEVDGSRFHVHCISREQEIALQGGRMERLVAWLFADGPAESRRPR